MWMYIVIHRIGYAGEWHAVSNGIYTMLIIIKFVMSLEIYDGDCIVQAGKPSDDTITQSCTLLAAKPLHHHCTMYSELPKQYTRSPCLHI